MYVPTGRPRGRPRKVVTEPIVEVPKKKRGRPPKNKTEVVAKKLGRPPKNKKELALEEGTNHFPTQTATGSFINKRYHFKDGSSCLVVYGSCKLKPIDIKLYKEKNVTDT